MGAEKEGRGVVGAPMPGPFSLGLAADAGHGIGACPCPPGTLAWGGTHGPKAKPNKQLRIEVRKPPEFL